MASEYRGLGMSPIKTDPPQSLLDAIEIIPQRLYWMTIREKEPPKEAKVHFFTTDFDFVYEPFFADFGPLNLGLTYRYCRMIESKARK